jgi:hypothetical protein
LFSYPLDAHPNFENFRDATATSDYLRQGPPNSRFRVVAPRIQSIDDFLTVFMRDYNLNYFTYLLIHFNELKILCPTALLQVFLKALSACQRYFSVPLLASLLPSIYRLDFEVYQLIPIKSDEDMLDDVVLNMEVWMHSDCASIKQIINHWRYEVLERFATAFDHRWHVQRLLSNFIIFFFSDAKCNSTELGRDVGLQISLSESVRDQALIHSFALFHSQQELGECRESYRLIFRFLPFFAIFRRHLAPT